MSELPPDRPPSTMTSKPAYKVGGCPFGVAVGVPCPVAMRRWLTVPGGRGGGEDRRWQPRRHGCHAGPACLAWHGMAAPREGFRSLGLAFQPFHGLISWLRDCRSVPSWCGYLGRRPATPGGDVGLCKKVCLRCWWLLIPARCCFCSKFEKPRVLWSLDFVCLFVGCDLADLYGVGALFSRVSAGH